MSDFTANPFVWVGIGCSFTFSGLFFRLYQDKKKELEKLKEIPVFKPGPLLVGVLTASPHKRLQYVAVEGMVQADGEPIASQYVPQCSGVIQRIVVEERWKYWNSFTRTWNSRTMNKKETNNMVPFSLVDPRAFINNFYIKVHKPLEASGDFMERVYHKMKRAEEDVVNIVLQSISGEKPGALVVEEEMLKVGSTLTGFGEVILEGGQVMRLQAPQDGRKYILVPGDYRSFMDRHESSASMWKTLTALTGITGATVLAAVIYSAVGDQDRRSK
ncbi:mitochondrial ubiquitin ligase activator of nfkb 1-A [Eucyclogobius newberryi]|uniref:mitochondrial ubiquitin ligase activator of nfkb 1-A n=1 Tax=Eucyclogobius newberryi TaxID=166745 RepID=UPI003B5B3BDF